MKLSIQNAHRFFMVMSVFATLVSSSAIASEDIITDPTLNLAVSAQLEIKGTLKASCSLTLPPPVSLGDIPIVVIEEKSGEKSPGDYAKTFKIDTSCSGTDKYMLEFKADNVSERGCLEASSKALAFCLFRGDKKIDLGNEAGRKITGEIKTGGETLKVQPARGSKAPYAGDHTGTMTVSIAPL